jgi:menaquinone-dependent protoporphyrinogen oxidase
MTEAGAENTRASDQARAEAGQRVEDTIREFFAQTKWKSDMVKPVAGAVLYTKYNFLVRFVMKQISKSEGGSTDTSRDHEYTDWAALDRFVDELVVNIG